MVTGIAISLPSAVGDENVTLTGRSSVIGAPVEGRISQTKGVVTIVTDCSGSGNLVVVAISVSSVDRKVHKSIPIGVTDRPCLAEAVPTDNRKAGGRMVRTVTGITSTGGIHLVNKKVLRATPISRRVMENITSLTGAEHILPIIVAITIPFGIGTIPPESSTIGCVRGRGNVVTPMGVVNGIGRVTDGVRTTMERMEGVAGTLVHRLAILLQTGSTSSHRAVARSGYGVLRGSIEVHERLVMLVRTENAQDDVPKLGWRVPFVWQEGGKTTTITTAACRIAGGINRKEALVDCV